jgi:hypothetical protein
MSRIVRKQFTRWDGENFPQFDNREYLEYERRDTNSGSFTIISYGYQEIEGTSYRWVPIDYALSRLNNQD